MKPTDRAKLYAWKPRVPLIAVLVLCISSIAFLTRPPWFDEVLTLGWLTLGFAKIPFTYPIPNNHIVYTMLLSLWESAGGSLAGNWILFMRLLSLIVGCGTLFLLSRFLIRRCGFASGAVCSLLFAVSGPMVLFSTALRGYGTALLFCVAAFLAAEKWMKNRIICGYGLLYLLFCYLAVGVMPTALFALLAGAVFFAPLFFRKKQHCFLLFAIPVLSVPLFYAHIFGKLIEASNLREGWSGYCAAYWNLYVSFAFMFLPILFFAIAGAWILWKKHPELRMRLLCFMFIFAMPLLFIIPAKVPPFPRIFFPFFGIWIIILSILFQVYFRSANRIGKTVSIIFTGLWLVLTPNITPQVSNLLFGKTGNDDLLCPYPVSAEFIPMKAAEAIRQNMSADGAVFIDFDADPPSLRFILMNFNIPAESVLYDNPDSGKVTSLPSGALIVCREKDDLVKLKQRFSLDCEFEPLFERGMQKVYKTK